MNDKARFLAAILALLLTTPGVTPGQSVSPHAGMLRYPDVGPTHIVFVYANDLWLVPRSGGTASPLTSPPGAESFARFSPDGATIAFVGHYDGNRDIYTVPVAGGVPHRVTHHPAGEVLVDWTPDGERLVFFSNGTSGIRRQTQLFTVASAGGLPTKMGVPYGAFGSVHSDGRRLAYVPHSRDSRTWKRYRGGLATDVWIFDLESKESTRVTNWEGTDSFPSWHGDRVYYLSDAGPAHRLNIWVYDAVTGGHRQVTKFDDFDVKWPSTGPGEDGRGEMVFQYGSSLCLLDLKTEEWRKVEVSIPGDRPALRARRVETKGYISDWHVSPTAKRAVVEARGDIWTLPAEHGTARNITRTDGVAERDPSWSPDGRWIAYFSDATGEYELHVSQSDGKGETRKLTSLGTGFRSAATWSPDSKHISFRDDAGSLWLHTLEGSKTQRIATDPGWGGGSRISWAPDSRWIAYTRRPERGMNASIYIYGVEDGESRRVTQEMFNDAWPTFDRLGKWLYFASQRSFSPRYGDLDTTFTYADSQVLLAVPLSRETKSPWAPESDEEKWDDEDVGKDTKDEEKKDEEEKAAEDDMAAADPLTGTWQGRLTGPTPPMPPGGVDLTATLRLAEDDSVTGTLSIPLGDAEVTSGRFDRATGELTLQLSADDGESWEINARVSGEEMEGTAVEASRGLQAEFTAKRESREVPGEETAKKSGGRKKKKIEPISIDFEGFERRALILPVGNGRFGGLSVNSKGALIYVRSDGAGASSIKLFDMSDKKRKEKKVTDGRGFVLSADGKSLLKVAGRGASMLKASAGASGKPVVTAGMVAVISPRQEWRQIFVDAWRLQRDFFYVENMHGVDWNRVRVQYEPMIEDCVTREDVGYVIREMIAELNVGHAYYRPGDIERTKPVTVGLLGVDFVLDEGAYRIQRIHEGAPWDADARGPLSQPGVDVKEGDWLLAVDGVPLDPTVDPWAPFVGRAGQTTTLTLSARSTLDEEAREVVVKPLASESTLRYRNWIEANRAHVDERTAGRVGYIYVPNTGVQGQNDLFRQFYGQIGKDALIIDERWNGGGQIPTRFIELLNRPVTNYWARRHARNVAWPPDAHRGPKCMLINGHAGSGGDAFPAYFRQAGLGKLIGTRTWGGLVGISGNPRLIDGASVTVPTFGYFETDGTWGIEGHGVEPDFEVVDDPALMVNGADPQLEFAIEHMLAEIEKRPFRAAPRPRDPQRAGMGITEADR